MKKIPVLFLALLISSCNVSLVYKPETIKELLPVGTKLRLTQTLIIPAERAMIYIANGKVVPLKNFNTVDVYEPYCMFYLHNGSNQPRQIEPDQFDVIRVVEWEGYHGNTSQIKLASIDDSNIRLSGLFNGIASSDIDAGPSIIMYATILRLHSAKQPEVKELVCGHWDHQGTVEPLTLQEMKVALGDLVVIATDNK
jgi:hypothetical protein